MSVNKDILCRIKGVVTQDFVCGKYLEINVSNPNEIEKYKCIDCEFFIHEGAGPDARHIQAFASFSPSGITTAKRKGYVQNSAEKSSKMYLKP